MSDGRFAVDEWCYLPNEVPEGDARKFVTLEQDGMVWVGIRAFDHSRQRWLNGGEPERATVRAWRHLVEPAKGVWFGGRLYIKGSVFGNDAEDYP